METVIQVKERPILFNGEMVRAVLDGRKTQTRRVMNPQPIPNEHKEGKHWVSNNSVKSMIDVEDFLQGHDKTVAGCFCPYGAPGDQLWVRETWRTFAAPIPCDDGSIEDRSIGLGFKSDDGLTYPDIDNVSTDVLHRLGKQYEQDMKSTGIGVPRWRPSIHMPRWASRIQLEITDVRVERVQDISGEDAQKEGCTFVDFGKNKWGNQNPGWRCGDAATHHGQALDTPRFAFANIWNSINEKCGLGWDINPWVWVVEFHRL